MVRSFGLVCPLLLGLLCLCSAANPGIKAQLSKKGLHYGVDTISRYLLSHVTATPLPDINGTVPMGQDTMNYEFTWIRIRQFQYSNISSAFVPGTGVQVSINGGNSTIHSHFKLNGWLMNDTGSSILTLSEISASVTIGVRRNNSNIPSIYLADCQFEIKGVDITMNGEVSSIYDAIKPTMEKMIRSKLHDHLCSSLRYITQHWDQTLSQSQLNISLLERMAVDLSLADDPVFTEQYAEIGLKGMFHSLLNETDTTIDPEPMSFTSQGDSMLSVGISESALNSACQAYFAGGDVAFRLSDYFSSLIINTSHLSSIIPEISQRFKQPEKVDFAIKAPKAPVLTMSPNVLKVEIDVVIIVIDLLPDGTTEMLSTANADISMSSNISISSTKDLNGFNISGSISLNR
ncbi:BPI fold-containing family C protein-like [Spea bombifrons]|uniref:BPI fold-containing family C protein-like n=1 Tax=Spea bombifrons TaxID=233779 RepID=UPI00234A563F|nr:BPI fold-containing family C protein-like [Spea bombifrons]